MSSWVVLVLVLVMMLVGCWWGQQGSIVDQLGRAVRMPSAKVHVHRLGHAHPCNVCAWMDLLAMDASASPQAADHFTLMI
jgi:hypothetical protein